MENDIEAKHGHYFTFRTKLQKGWDGITHYEIISVDPQTSLSYTYRPYLVNRYAHQISTGCSGSRSHASQALAW